MNKNIQDLKVKIESIKEKPNWRQSRNEKFKSLNINVKSKPHQQNHKMQERTSGTEDTIEEMNILVKENHKSKKNPGTKQSENSWYWKDQIYK